MNTVAGFSKLSRRKKINWIWEYFSTPSKPLHY
jgi:hypothetical protein